MGSWLENLMKENEKQQLREEASRKETEKRIKPQDPRAEIAMRKRKREEATQKAIKENKLYPFLERIGAQSFLADIKNMWPRGKIIEILSSEFYTSGLDVNTLTVGFMFARKYFREGSNINNDFGAQDYGSYAVCIDGIGICAKDKPPYGYPEVYFKSGTLLDRMRLGEKIKEEFIEEAKFNITGLEGIKIVGVNDAQITEGLRQRLGEEFTNRQRNNRLPYSERVW